MSAPERDRIPPSVRRAVNLPASKATIRRELDDEVRFHIESRAAELVAGGMNEHDALTEARRRFGDADDLREYCQSIEVPKMRRLRTREGLESWWQDLRFARRQFKRSPGFVAVTMLTLGLGIGAATAIFSVVDNVLLRPLAYPDPDRIVDVAELSAKGTPNQVDDPTFDDWTAQSRSFSALATFRPSGPTSVLIGDRPLRAPVAMVSARFFDVLGVKPLRGRFFAGDEVREKGAPAVLVGEQFWRREFGGDPAVLGTTLKLGGDSYMIVGVLPASADFPSETDLWISAEVHSYHHTSRTAHNWMVLGRLAPGVSLAQARSDVSAITRRLKQQYGKMTDATDASVVPLREEMVGKTETTLLLLLAASAVLLLIACANVVNLLIARMAARQGELAVRVALGAARWRLVQQCLVEAFVLSLGGALLGIGLAAAGVKVLLVLRPPSLPRLDEVHVDARVLAFAIVMSVVVAAALGILAAVQGTRGDIREALSQTQRTQSGGGSSAGIRRALVVAQMGLTVVLLVSAALLARSFARVLSVNTGFRVDHAVVLDLAIPAANGDSVADIRRGQQFEDLLARLRAVPGVARVGGATSIPFVPSGSNGAFLIKDRRVETNSKPDVSEMERLFRTPGNSGYADYRMATLGYFETMHIPLLRGRFFNEGDTRATENVAVISDALAKKTWPNESALGKYIDYSNMDGDTRTFTVVGVVGDVRERGFESDPRATFYGLFRQRPSSAGGLYIVMETNGDPSSVIAAARGVVRAIRPDVPPQFRTMDAIVGRSIAARRFTLVLVGVFGAAALLLATLGVYSVVSYLVAQRGRELTIRVALGARSEDIVRLVLRQGVVLALVGIVLGAVAAFAATRLIGAMLFGIGATDPVAFVGVTVVLAGAAVLASYVPARRASRVDAMDVLRSG